jgi:Xaa-Pro aminopeptidase
MKEFRTTHLLGGLSKNTLFQRLSRQTMMQEAQEGYRAFLTPVEEVERRITALQGLLADRHLDGALLCHPVDMFYFSGSAQNGYLWIPAGGHPVLWVRRSLDRARRESPLREIHPYPGLRDLGHLIAANKGCRIGLEMDVLPAKDFLRIQQGMGKARLEDASALIRRVRQTKSPFELGCMRQAARLHAEVFAEIPGLIRASRTEIELAAQIECALRRREHQGLVRLRRWNQDLFYGPVVSGSSACYPTPFDGPVGAQGLYPALPQGAGRKRLQEGEPILVDVVFGYNGYCVDKARTFALGSLSGEWVDAYRLCQDIQEEILCRLLPGKPCSEVYEEVVRGFENKSPFWPHFMGCEDNKVHFLGHGVGLELDEWPVLAPGFKEILRPGMTLAVEPKFFPPGKGGVGLENTCLVTDHDAEKITDFPDDLVIC